jgi:hypothetical protein
MPQYLGIHLRYPPPSRATAEELRWGVELLVDLQAGHEPQGLIVPRGHLAERLVGKIERGIRARIQVPGGTDTDILALILRVVHLLLISG